mmetsp:Transcript_15300/g.52414  ORF Transcript_15300/g.52414 Transcript_15300/m.52414 type:complete len:209 (-) Transcript_15300:2-628(-)
MTIAWSSTNLYADAVSVPRTDAKIESRAAGAVMRRPAVALRKMAVAARSASGTSLSTNSSMGARLGPAAAVLVAKLERPGLTLNELCVASTSTAALCPRRPLESSRHLKTCARQPDEPASTMTMYFQGFEDSRRTLSAGVPGADEPSTALSASRQAHVLSAIADSGDRRAKSLARASVFIVAVLLRDPILHTLHGSALLVLRAIVRPP